MYRDLASSSTALAPFVNASLLQTPGGRKFLSFLRDLSSHAVAGGAEAASASASSSSPSPSPSLSPLARPQSGKEGEGGVQGRVSFPDLHQLQGVQVDEA